MKDSNVLAENICLSTNQACVLLHFSLWPRSGSIFFFINKIRASRQIRYLRVKTGSEDTTKINGGRNLEEEGQVEWSQIGEHYTIKFKHIQ